jgi:hypothetical protein
MVISYKISVSNVKKRFYSACSRLLLRRKIIFIMEFTCNKIKNIFYPHCSVSKQRQKHCLPHDMNLTQTIRYPDSQSITLLLEVQPFKT